MPLKTKENYLKSMYLMAVDEGKISLSGLGQRMGVSLPTVNSMIKKLHDEGLVLYEKHKSLRLTPLGRKTAGLIIRKHRIVEMFLVKELGFGWEEVHDIAEEMEHIQSEILFERMDAILGYPTIDPHGSPIPDKDGILEFRNKLKLSQTKAGNKVVLTGIINTSTDFLNYLDAKELKPGTELNVLVIEPFDKSMTISTGSDSTVVLSREVCERLYVEVLE